MGKHDEPWNYKFGCIRTATGGIAIHEHRKRLIACVNSLSSVAYPEKLPALLKALACFVGGDDEEADAAYDAVEKAWTALGYEEDT